MSDTITYKLFPKSPLQADDRLGEGMNVSERNIHDRGNLKPFFLDYHTRADSGSLQRRTGAMTIGK